MSFTVHSYKEFLSWSDRKKPILKNQYQINLPYLESQFNIDYKKLMNDPDYTLPLRMDTKTSYFIILFFYCNPPTEIKKFLEYHYDKYSGEKEDFIYFIEWTLEEIKIHIDKWVPKDIHRTIYTVPVILKEWIKEKRSVVKAWENNQIEGKTLAKNRISHAKQMILLDRLGILDHLENKGLTTKENKAKIISLLIDKNEQNTREYLTYGVTEPKKTEKKKYFYRTPENIDFIDKLFKELDLS